MYDVWTAIYNHSWFHFEHTKIWPQQMIPVSDWPMYKKWQLSSRFIHWRKESTLEKYILLRSDVVGNCCFQMQFLVIMWKYYCLLFFHPLLFVVKKYIFKSFNDQKTGSTNSLIYMVAKSCRNILYKHRSKLQLKTLTTFICKIYFLFTD